MVFGWFLAKRTTVLLRGQCHAHLFFCKKPARLQLSLCARSSKLSSQQHQCSYSLCTASNSTLAPAAQQQQAPVAAASRTIAQAASTTRISLDFRGRQVLLYVLLLPMVCYYVLGRALPSMPLVFQCTYTTIRSGSLGCFLTGQHRAALASQGSRAAAFGQTSQLLQHDQIGERTQWLSICPDPKQIAAS